MQKSSKTALPLGSLLLSSCRRQTFAPNWNHFQVLNGHFFALKNPFFCTNFVRVCNFCCQGGLHSPFHTSVYWHIYVGKGGEGHRALKRLQDFRCLLLFSCCCCFMSSCITWNTYYVKIILEESSDEVIPLAHVFTAPQMWLFSPQTALITHDVKQLAHDPMFIPVWSK